MEKISIRFPVLLGKTQHLECLCPVTKIFLLVLEIRDITATNGNFKIHVSVHTGIKKQTWKKGNLIYISHPFQRVALKKKKCLSFHFFLSKQFFYVPVR